MGMNREDLDLENIKGALEILEDNLSNANNDADRSIFQNRINQIKR
jgi:hypothetical protein